MTPEQIAALAAAGESETQEFKRSTGQRREAARTLCAMLNHRGGRVLFGRADQLLPDFAQCLLRVARFRGMEKGEFLDNRQFHGHAFDLFQRAQRFVLDHMPIAGRFEPGRMERIDEPAYSPLAFREAIANAICHRDYATGGSSIGVAMYDDRLEVTSSGALHFGFTPQALFEPHESRPWNPLIASVFYRRGIIETWGQGTLKMASWAEAAGLPKPEILEVPGAVVVRFPRKLAVTTTGETPQKTPQKTPDAILELLRQQPRLAFSDIALLVGKSESAVKRAVRKLRESGRLQRIGPDKGGSWRVIE